MVVNGAKQRDNFGVGRIYLLPRWDKFTSTIFASVSLFPVDEPRFNMFFAAAFLANHYYIPFSESIISQYDYLVNTPKKESGTAGFGVATWTWICAYARLRIFSSSRRKASRNVPAYEPLG
jgi:hypothetical protein